MRNKKCSKKTAIKQQIRFAAACLFMLIFLTSCWDSVEIESRAFVTAIAIDKYGEDFAVAMEIPYINSEKDIASDKSIKSNEDKTLSAAIYGIDRMTDKSLYLGPVKLAVLGENILKDEKMFRQSISTLSKDRDISRKLIILSAKEAAAAVIKAEDEADKLIGTYIASYYKKNNPSLVYRQDLDRLSRGFAEDGIVVIPNVYYENEKLIFSGGAVCENYKLAGWLNSDELNGLLWIYSQAEGAFLQWKENGIFTALSINKCKTHMDFYEEEGIIYARLNIEARADICESFAGDSFNSSEVSKKSSDLIRAQINTAYDALYNKIGVDGFGLLSNMEKKNPDLHKIYFENMGMDFREIPVIVNINIETNNTGYTE